MLLSSGELEIFFIFQSPFEISRLTKWLNIAIGAGGLGFNSGQVKAAQCHQRLATAATFLRSCVAQALRREDGPHHSLHALAWHREHNEDLVLFLCRILLLGITDRVAEMNEFIRELWCELREAETLSKITSWRWEVGPQNFVMLPLRVSRAIEQCYEVGRTICAVF